MNFEDVLMRLNSARGQARRGGLACGCRDGSQNRWLVGPEILEIEVYWKRNLASVKENNCQYRRCQERRGKLA